MKALTAYFDGASKGNPGPSGIGGVLFDGDHVIAEVKEYIGIATNNQAEYSALIAVLEEAKKLGAETLSIFADSELVVRQLTGEYRVKNPKLAPLFLKASQLRKSFLRVTFRHVPREKNKLADALANLAVAEGRK